VLAWERPFDGELGMRSGEWGVRNAGGGGRDAGKGQNFRKFFYLPRPPSFFKPGCDYCSAVRMPFVKVNLRVASPLRVSLT